MEAYCQCRLRGRRTTQLEDFDHVHGHKKSCKFFRLRDLDEIDVRSKFVIPRLENIIKELEETLAFYESKEKRMKWVEKKDYHDKIIKEKKKKTNYCSINWKIIIMCVMVFFLVLGLNKQVKDDKCSCVHLQLP
ncbi:hypothetical protein HAX54_031903 [Datura stramonium]|uniref:Uncharacterized protein n=1 Tax=Datura stramonium TaxID=4076 RepID=A0ABS8VD40_DATST|nr:hypothetical protein [Datura stramonium]